MSKRILIPKPYQAIMRDFALDNESCSLWAGMGMGKTSSTLLVLDTLLSVEPAPILVIAPLRVARSTWPDEVQKWADFEHLRVSAIVGSVADRFRAMQAKADIYTTNFENIPWLKAQWGDRWPYRIVVVDESTKLKGFRTRQGTERARALASVRKKIDRMTLLTGTPSPNGLQDLWGQQWFVDQGAALGDTYTAFKDRWFTVGDNGYGLKPRTGAEEEIHARLRSTCLSVRPEDWFDLEAPRLVKLDVHLPASARALYEKLEDDMFAEMSSGAKIEAVHAAALTMKCLQVASGAVLDGEREIHHIHNEKIDALQSVIEETGGEPVLVAYQFNGALEMLKKAFPKARTFNKASDITAWNNGDVPIGLIHPASAGHGLNLQDGGRNLVYYDHWWNLEERLQVAERLGPMRQLQSGHNRTVNHFLLVAKDTVDEQVIARSDDKRSIQDTLMAAMRDRRKAR